MPAASRRRGGRVAVWLAALWLAAIAIAALAADWLPLQDPAAMDLPGRRGGPSAGHWLGTDALGRDILSRAIHGARTSLLIGLAAPAAGLILGGSLGLLAGYYRGRLESLATAAMDVLLAFPALILALAFTAFLGPGLVNLTLALGILTIPTFARVARASTLAWATRDFVIAARVIGASDLRILAREVLPNVLPSVGTVALVAVAVIIVAEGSLSFLGLGVPAPRPSWGGMIAEGREPLEAAPHIVFIPAAFMFFTVLALNLLGDHLRGRSDSREAAL